MWLSSKGTLLRNQADLIVLRGCESYHMHQEEFRIANCGFRIEISQSSERFCTDPQSEILLWKGSLTGKAVVLKTTALVACRFDSCPFRQFTSWRRRLTVWQRFAKSPRIACAGSTPAASANVSAVRSSDSTGGCLRSSLTAGRIRGPVAQRNQSATLRRSRSHVQIVPGPLIPRFLRSGRVGKARVSETRLRRFESYLRSQFEKFDAEYTGVVKPPGTDS